MNVIWVKATERAPTEDDAIDGDVFVAWVHSDGRECIGVTHFSAVRPEEYWMAKVEFPRGCDDKKEV